MLNDIRAGSVRALARAASLIENRHPAAAPLLRQLFPQTGRAAVFGITGPPGAGKSTLTGQLICALRREGQRVAIIAVDPSSPFSGGAILGDRIRMNEHHADPCVFIRSLATRGSFGGLAPAAADLTLLFDAAGFDTILIETVGVGQDETDIARLAQVTALVLVPGLGDDVQTMKAGIMEIADVYLINKADHAGAERLEQQLRALLEIGPGRDGWQPPIVRTVAPAGEGIDAALAALRAFPSERRPAREIEAWRRRLRDLYREQLLLRLGNQELETAAQSVAARREDPYSIVQRWLDSR